MKREEDIGEVQCMWCLMEKYEGGKLSPTENVNEIF